MSAHAVSTPQLYVKESARSIALRTRGHSHGSVTRLVSPGDIGELIKPFVFLDYFDADPENAPSFGFHPHSGIATLTLILAGQAFYRETTDRQGVIETGGVELMRASSGVWHTGGMYGKERIKGFQLWVAMPPALELAEPDSQYLNASDFHFAGPARVIAGEYDGVKSIVESPQGMTYLDVRLKAGERWIYQPPEGHDVAWIASHQGMVATPERVSTGEVVVFEEGDQAIQFEALSDAGFVLGSAVKHPYDLVTGHYSVHTNAEALRVGENNIAEIGRRLHKPPRKLTSGEAISSGEVSMPLLRYFGWVGSFLLALLFVANWFFPEPTARTSLSDAPLRDKVSIRIHSDHKWPEKVVLDTAMAMPPLNAKASPEAASQTAKPFTGPGDRKSVLEAFAEMARPGAATRSRNLEQEDGSIRRGSRH